jgi:hypothetical protein
MKIALSYRGRRDVSARAVSSSRNEPPFASRHHGPSVGFRIRTGLRYCARSCAQDRRTCQSSLGRSSWPLFLLALPVSDLPARGRPQGAVVSPDGRRGAAASPNTGIESRAVRGSSWRVSFHAGGSVRRQSTHPKYPMHFKSRPNSEHVVFTRIAGARLSAVS